MQGILFLLATLVGAACGDDFYGGGGGDADADTDTDSDADSDADSDTDSCAAIDDGPFDLERLTGPVAAEDLAFDAEGNVVGSNGTSLFRSPIDGPPAVFAPIAQQAGLRYLPSGILVVADDVEGDLYLVEPDGTSELLLADLAYPNGIAIDLAGFVYLTEKSAGSVRRIDPFHGDFVYVVSGGIAEPNGITFDPSYRHLYIAGTSGEGIIHRVSIAADGTPGDLEEWVSGVGRGRLDGLAVDVCGNVYVCDYGSGVGDGTLVYRISPDGERARLISSSEGGEWTFLANMDWGTGIGGWSTTSLYFAETSSQSIFEMDIGVPSKPRAYP